MENIQKQDLKHVVICNRVHTLNLYWVFKDFTSCNFLILQLCVSILFEIFHNNSLGTVDVNLYNVNITQHGTTTDIIAWPFATIRLQTIAKLLISRIA